MQPEFDKRQIRYTNIDTILLRVETDSQFLDDIREIAEKKGASENQQYFDDKKKHISESELELIHDKALYHAAANIINENNMINSEDSKNTHNIHDTTLEKSLCFCGCKKEVGPSLSLFVNQQKIASLGSGVILLFFYLRHMRELVLMSFMIFGVFAFISNISAETKQLDGICYMEEDNQLEYEYCVFTVSISFMAVKENLLIIGYQYILGLFMIIIWIAGNRVIRALGEMKDAEVDELLQSASDYAVKIDDLPYGQYSQEELIEYLQFIWQKKSEEIVKITGKASQPKISSVQIIYNMEDCRELINQLSNLSMEMVSCIEISNFRYTNNIEMSKVQQYRKAKMQFVEKLQKLEAMRTQFLRNPETRRHMATTCAIIQFETQKDKNQFLSVLGESKNPIQNAFSPSQNIKFKDSSLKFARSPEPSDILWLNCEKKFNIMKVIVIWSVTIVILYVGYTFVSYTQTVEFFKELDHVVITIVLQLINRLIWFWLSIIISFESNNTKTEAIISSMTKSIIAQTINIIINPIIATFVNNKDLFGSSGLAGMALTYQFVMLGMMLVYYIFNPFYLGKKLILKIRCLRNIIIKYLIRVVGTIDTTEQIKPVLELYEGPELPVAGAYVYMSSAIFHAMFYCHLQPIILLIVTINMTIFFFIMKYMLYHRCKILQLTNNNIFSSAIFFSSCGAAYYAVGSIFFYVIDTNDESSIYMIVPSVICLLLWFASNFNIFNCLTVQINKLINYIKEQSCQNSPIKKKTTKKITIPPVKNDLEIQEIETSSVKTNIQDNIHKKMQDDPMSIEYGKTHLLNSNFTTNADLIFWKRKESYYYNSNTNSLLEFESILKQMKDEELMFKGRKLQEFCEQFNRVLKLKRSESEENKYRQKLLMLKKLNKNSEQEPQIEKGYKYTLIPVIKLKKEPQQQSQGNGQDILSIQKFQFKKR